MSIGTVVALIQQYAPGVSPSVIEQAVSDWLDDHPEATTTVEDGSITEEKLAADLAAMLSNMGDDVTQLKSDLTSMTVEEKLLRSELPGTTVVVAFGSDDNPSSITHSANGTTIRTDVFTWGTGSVEEVRTLSTGENITITTNLETLAQTISEVQEVA